MRHLADRLLVLSLLLWWPPSASAAVTRVEFLGEARIPGGSRVDGAPVGGLSGIDYDAARDLYYVVADDPSSRGPARFFGVEIDLAEGRLARDGVEVVSVTTIQSPAGGDMPTLSLDPEGIAVLPDGSLYISSEGQIDRQVAPFIRRYTREGRYLDELELPQRYLPSGDGSTGPRHNLVFESLTATPDGRWLFAALENALIQDGPKATLAAASPSRMLRFDLASGELLAEYLYWAEPVAAPASVPDGLEVSGLVELLAIDEQRLLAMERSFSMGTGNTIRIFLIGLQGADDIRSIQALRDVDLAKVVPVDKELLVDLAELEIYLDNVEGMTFGPRLPDGRRTLLLVSDDNFNPLIQTTQILAFALGEEPVGIEEIQGAGHRSPLEGEWVRGIEGVVTGLLPGQRAGFWIESPVDDGAQATSRGVFVVRGEGINTPALEERITVDGRVLERDRPGELGTTEIRASRVTVLGAGRRLPSPVVGSANLGVPAEVVEDDQLRVFEPLFDGLDFWESLEGMRIAVTEAPVVGPTNRYGDLVIDVTGAPKGDAATRAGGLLLRPGDANPERLVIDFAAIGEAPEADVGARFDGRLEGNIGYRFGTYRLYVQPPVPSLIAATVQPESTELRPAGDRITIATFNVLNLSAVSTPARFRAVAQTLTAALGSPDIVALQEIQDDSGPADDGTVGADRTLERLIAAVVEMGGPAYEFRQIDPVDNQDGGAPGANIRPVFLFNPERVDFPDRGTPGPGDAVDLIEIEGRWDLSPNPGRVVPGAAAFRGDDSRGFSPSRKSLAAEFHFGVQRIFVVNNHWSSKRGDDQVFGATQPPIPRSEDQRAQQARWLADLVERLQSQQPAVTVVVLGDFNEHEFRAPVRILSGARLENLAFRVPESDRYSFNFRGNSQLLDHILISVPSLDADQVRFDIVHGNADRAAKSGSSDHDPLIVELDFSRVE